MTVSRPSRDDLVSVAFAAALVAPVPVHAEGTLGAAVDTSPPRPHVDGNHF